MSENLIPDPLFDALPPHNSTILNGRDVVSDPGMAQFRRHIAVLAVIAAPYANMNGDDPLNPLDHVGEWRQLIEMLAATTRQQSDSAPPLAVARLLPATSARLGQALSDTSPDAFQVVHLACHGERDMLYLEDEIGHEAYAVAEHVVRLFKAGRVRLVFMDGCFSRRLAQMLIDETSVEAVVGTRRRVSGEPGIRFVAQFYAAISEGTAIRQAYRAALSQSEQADRYEFVTRDEDIPVHLTLPAQPAARPLLADGQPPLLGVPVPFGFVGQRELLTLLAEHIPGTDYRAYLLRGGAGVGKTWVAAEFVYRFACRFPGGVLWFHASAPTTAREILAQIARLLNISPYAADAEIMRELSARGMLLVIDQLDLIESADELVDLRALIEQIDPVGGSRALLLARHIPAALSGIEGSREYELAEMSPKDARTLAMRLAVERGIEALDVDTIDDFLERTQHYPWLIVKGVHLIESDGLAYALDDLAAFQPSMPDALALYLTRRLKLLEKEASNPLGLLTRVQDLPGAFDAGLIRALGGEQALLHVQALVKASLLQRDGGLYLVPPAALNVACKLYPLRPEQQAPRDKFVMYYLIKTWPPAEEWSAQTLTQEQQARLNHVRALVQRQIDPARQFDPVVLAHLLTVTAPAFRVAGLAEEFIGYAQAVRGRLPEGDDVARLQIALGEALSRLPDRENEAGWTLQATAAMQGINNNTIAEAHRAYGLHLFRLGQYESAQRVFWQGLQVLIPDPDAHVLLASSLAHDWAKVLIAAQEYEDVLPRLDAALAGYAQAERSDLSAGAHCDLGEALIALGEWERAEDVLRRALITAEYASLRSLAGRVRHLLAQVHNAYAVGFHQQHQTATSTREWRAAEEQLNEAVADLLPYFDVDPLAAVYLLLGQVQGRLGQLDDAASNAARARNLYERARMLPELAAAALALGQLSMVKGDSVTAQLALHEALDRAATLDERDLVKQTAGVLVRVHQIRARHAQRADSDFRRDALEQARYTRDHLVHLGLAEHVAALDAVIHSFS